jgi:hypothetical protein
MIQPVLFAEFVAFFGIAGNDCYEFRIGSCFESGQNGDLGNVAQAYDRVANFC